MNLAPKLQLVKISLIDEFMPNENDHCSTCTGSTIYQQAYLLVSKYEFTLEYTTMYKHLAKVQTVDYRWAHSLRTCLGLKGCLIRLGRHFQKTCCLSPVWHKKDAATSLPWDRSSVQASSLALAGGCSLHSCLPALGQFVSTAALVCMSPWAQVNAW